MTLTEREKYERNLKRACKNPETAEMIQRIDTLVVICNKGIAECEAIIKKVGEEWN